MPGLPPVTLWSTCEASCGPGYLKKVRLSSEEEIINSSFQGSCKSVTSSHLILAKILCTQSKASEPYSEPKETTEKNHHSLSPYPVPMPQAKCVALQIWSFADLKLCCSFLCHGKHTAHIWWCRFWKPCFMSMPIPAISLVQVMCGASPCSLDAVYNRWSLADIDAPVCVTLGDSNGSPYCPVLEISLVPWDSLLGQDFLKKSTDSGKHPIVFFSP